MAAKRKTVKYKTLIYDNESVDGELIDPRFDGEGIAYSGYIPKPKTYRIYHGGEMQRPLTEREQEIRQYWANRKDPINFLLMNRKFDSLI